MKVDNLHCELKNSLIKWKSTMFIKHSCYKEEELSLSINIFVKMNCFWLVRYSSGILAVKIQKKNCLKLPNFSPSLPSSTTPVIEKSISAVSRHGNLFYTENSIRIYQNFIQIFYLQISFQFFLSNLNMKKSVNCNFNFLATLHISLTRILL